MEREKEGGIAFLDVMVIRDGDHLHTSVYCKPTHTDCYISFYSHHHLIVLTGVMRCIHNSTADLWQHQQGGQNAAYRSSLPGQWISWGTSEEDPVISTSNLGHLASRRRQPPWGRTTKNIVYTLRTRGKWEVGEGLCPPWGESCVQTTKDNKADACTGEREDPHRKKERKKEVVYEVACKDCDQKYIGETKRTMKERLTEHKYVVRRGDEKNGIAVHANKFNHSIDWESAGVRSTAQGYWNRRTLEAMQIRRTACPMNLDCGLHLSPVWNSLIDQTWTI